MKKTYKNPTLKVVNIKPASMIATSEALTMRGTYDSGSVTIATRESRFSTWEDDDE